MLSEVDTRDALRAPLEAVVPVAREITADTETPVSAFLKLRSGGTAFLLESGERDGRLGRYSFIGAEPDAVLRATLTGGTVTSDAGARRYDGPPLDAVRELAGRPAIWRGGTAGRALPRFAGGIVGAFGFDLSRALEDLPTTLPDDTGFPAALFARYHTVLAFDHLKQRLLCISLLPAAESRGERRRALVTAADRIASLLDRLRSPLPARDPRPPSRPAADVTTTPSDPEFLASVAHAMEHIHSGEAIQIVLSRRLGVAFPGDPFDLYRSLRTVSPSPYMFYLEFPELALAGCSPEMLLRAENGVAQLSPIAGTRPRGDDAAADERNESELLANEKERSEHVMLVDLARNDLGRVCGTGTVGVPSYMQVERFSHVMHLVSVVTGRLRDGVDALDAFAASFPAGTVSGAPKVRAMQLIEELETFRRGSYGGAVAHIAPGCGELDACITIRTIAVRDGNATVQVGVGVVADSTPQGELEETRAKARPMLEVLGIEEPPAGVARAPRVAAAAEAAA